VVGAGAAATAESRAAAPKLKLVKAPPSSTRSREALFRFKVTPSKLRTWCKLDDRPYRKCRGSVRYRSLRVQRHTFTVRAKNGDRRKTVRHRWRVMAAAKPAPPTPPAPAAPTTGSSAPAFDPSAPLFDEEFNGTTLDPAVWDIYDGPGHAYRGLRSPSALTLDGQGNLVLTATYENGQIVSGGMGHRVNYTYGHYAFRVRLDPDPTGTMSGNVLTWPRDQWSPEFTENDIWETGWHPDNNYRFNTFIHFGVQNWQHWIVHPVDPSQWHIIEMDWRPERLAIYIDGAFAWETLDQPAIPDIPHHICFQLDPEANRPLAHPQKMYVDWVRIYR
jgi:endo-1,3-1,4-beta-glycanase ExoK